MDRARARSKLEIYYEVLQAISRGIDKPTRIMHTVNLSWPSIKNILSFLIQQDLIIKNKKGKKSFRFKLTDKGEHSILSYQKLSSMAIALGFFQNQNLLAI